MSKKATFEDLIARKMKRENDAFKTKEIYVTSLDACLAFKKPDDNLILDVLNEIGSTEDMRKIVNGYKKLIYLTCEILQDTKLHKELEVIDPFDAVDKIFDLTDIMEIGEQLTELINIEKKVEQIKN